MNQPLFIYGDYPDGTTVTLANAAANQVGADILEANEDTYISPAATTLTVTIDLLSPVACGVLAIAGERLNGVTVDLRGSTDNFASSNVSLSAAAALVGTTAAWRAYTPAAYRYLRLIFTGATTATRIYHVAIGPVLLLPYMDDGADLDSFTATASDIISPQGHFLGTQQQKVERKFPLNWGQVDENEYLNFYAWAVACVYRRQPFFFVPDSAVTTCHFGYTDAGYKFSAPMKKGLRDMATIPFTSRLA